MKKIITLTVALITMTLSGHAQDQYVYSTKGNVNIRTAPSASAAKGGTLKKGEMFPLIETNGSWYKIDINGKPMYVSQSVATICDAVIPTEMFNKSIDSNKGADKIRFQGDIEISPIDKTHALINISWMRVNLPAESYCYIADVKDGKIIATHQRFEWGDASEGLKSLMENADKLEQPKPVGFDEWNNTLIFDGILYSEFE
ncbi:MAG: SH3 domain-containing protein [Paraprevotella sp.]|nr:SH3 domain-containing protein [Paraprevotella sp.]